MWDEVWGRWGVGDVECTITVLACPLCCGGLGTYLDNG